MFETGDAVKSCPAVDPFTGLVIVGSHDGHVYALNPKVSARMIQKTHCGGVTFNIKFKDSSRSFPGPVPSNLCQHSIDKSRCIHVSRVFRFSSVFGGVTAEVELCSPPPASTRLSGSCM